MSVKTFIQRRPSLMRAVALPLKVRRHMQARARQPFNEALSAILSSIEGDVWLRAKEFEGVFSISPNSDLFQRVVGYGQYEPELVSVFRAALQPDRDVIDVGANVGFFSVLSGKLLTSGKVLAVEPTRAAFSRLEMNVARNGVSDKVLMHYGAVSSSGGEISMNVLPGKEEYSSMGVLIHPGARGQQAATETVNASTLDALVEKYGLRPALIKVDVEGAEALVFAGATQTLVRHRPTVISELTPSLLKKMGADAHDVISMFERADYRVTDLHDPSVLPGSREFGDILCVPKS